MEVEISQKTGASLGERTSERLTMRNGYRERRLDTRVGSLALPIPKLREGSYFPSFLKPRRRSEEALLAVIAEAYVKGVSTRKVEDLVVALGLDGISKSEVSRICARLDEQVEAFRGRPLLGRYPYLFLDATYEKAERSPHRPPVEPPDVLASLSSEHHVHGARSCSSLRVSYPSTVGNGHERHVHVGWFWHQ